MNYQYSNGNEVLVENGFAIINKIKYELPKKCKGKNITTINGKIYIDGYEFKNYKFKRTLKALWHKWF